MPIARLRRRRFVLGALRLGLVLAGTSPLAGCGAQPLRTQPPTPRHRLGFLWGEPVDRRDPVVQPFLDGLRELGYVEGEKLTIEWRSAEGQPERLPGLAAELVRLRVALIVALTAAAVRAAQQTTQTIPIVMIINSDPVAQGLVASYARPGGNVTGFAPQPPELAGKRLEWLHELVPGLRRLALLWETLPAVEPTFRATQAAAQTLGVQVQTLEVRRPEDFEAAFAAATEAHPDALVTLGSPTTVIYRRRILDFAAQRRLPAMYDKPEFVRDGGLVAYMQSQAEFGRRTAAYVDRLLKGARPADLPVERPTRFDLIINLQTARALGLTIPQSVLAQATEAIQ